MKIISIIVVGIFILSGFGAVALNSDKEKLDFETIEYEELSSSTSSRDYTHTVLVEVGTSTTCPACPASNTAWHSIYGSGNYDFQYCEMVVNKNSLANAHMNNYNLYWVPTSYFDGGQFVYPGTNYGTFYNYLDSSGARTVPDLVSDLNVDRLGGTQFSIDFNITNNEAAEYPGTLRIYVIEKESTLWNDYNGNPYYHAFLDFAVNQPITIPAGGTYTDSVVWDGTAAGYPGITGNNLQVILSVFNDDPRQSYSDPPSGAPFWAYYVDETIADSPPFINTIPNIPTITGPTYGVLDISYDFTVQTTDPDGDDIHYYIDWGDGTNSGWLGPYDSGQNVIADNSWSTVGEYDITVKAKDTYDAESDWSDPLTIIIVENEAPGTPDIDGPTSGTAGESYEYTFVSTDPNGDDIYYCLDWGDDTGEVCFGPFDSGEEVTADHIWDEEGTYIVKCKARDIYGAESDWGTLEVTMPVNQNVLNSWLLQFLQNHPQMFPILRYIFGL